MLYHKVTANQEPVLITQLNLDLEDQFPGFNKTQTANLESKADRQVLSKNKEVEASPKSTETAVHNQILEMITISKSNISEMSAHQEINYLLL